MAHFFSADAPIRRIVEDRLVPLKLPPDLVMAWEPSCSASDFFSGMPDWLQAITVFANRSIVATLGHVDNPLVQLKALARPEDFVIFKLDVDDTVIEAVTIEQILDYPSLGALIYVLFWEHHHGMFDMRKYWQVSSAFKTADSFSIFKRLRKAGILAHVWP